MIKVLYIGNNLSHHGFAPGVIETLGKQLKESGYNVSYAGNSRSQLLRMVEMIYKILTVGRRVDYILIDTYSTLAFWYAYLTGGLSKILGTKYIPILHGGDLPKRLQRSKRACDKLFNNSYANVAVSGYLNHEFEKVGYKTVVIPNSIDISKYPFKLREQSRPKLLWVRSFHRQYNPLMAADVLEGLLQIHPDAEPCMVGPDKDGSLGEFKDYIRQKGTEEHVKITGKLSKEDWISLSENYDFFINTTNVDNTPVSVIEAMALGLCVISTNPDGIPYLLNDGRDSILVKPGDYSNMAKQISSIMNDPELAKQLSSNARRKAETYDWGAIRENWIRLLMPVYK